MRGVTRRVGCWPRDSVGERMPSRPAVSGILPYGCRWTSDRLRTRNGNKSSGVSDGELSNVEAVLRAATSESLSAAVLLSVGREFGPPVIVWSDDKNDRSPLTFVSEALLSRERHAPASSGGIASKGGTSER